MIFCRRASKSRHADSGESHSICEGGAGQRVNVRPLPPPAKKPRRVQESLCLPKSFCFIHSSSSSSSPSLIPLVSSSINSSSPCLPLLLFLLLLLLLLPQRPPPPPLLPQTSGGGVSGWGPPSTLTTAEREGNERRVRLQKGRTFSFLKEQLTIKFKFRPFSTHHHTVKGGFGDIF